MEQRIGRLDRIGQTQPVDIHVFDVRGTLASDVLSLLADAVGVFGETVGGLDAVLEEVEDRILELALAGAADRARVRGQCSPPGSRRPGRPSAARYDPLLDERSFDREAVQALVERAGARIGLELDPEGSPGGRALGHRPRPGRAAGGDRHRAGAPGGHRRGHRRTGGRLPVRVPLRARAQGRGAAGAAAGGGAHRPRNLLARHGRGAGGDRLLRHGPPHRRGAVRLPPRRALRPQRVPRHPASRRDRRAAWRCSSTSYPRSRRTPLRERAFPRGSSRACWTEV